MYLIASAIKDSDRDDYIARLGSAKPHYRTGEYLLVRT